MLKKSLKLTKDSTTVKIFMIDLLTLKAMKVIQKADLLLYDRLVSNDVLDLVAPNARLLYVGKTAGYHSRTQVFNFLPFFFAFFLFYFILF